MFEKKAAAAAAACERQRGKEQRNHTVLFITASHFHRQKEKIRGNSGADYSNTFQAPAIEPN
ncbi:hypothetical protein GQ55_4G355400 [Panicum hallii var. hallii]|uniref:Uncharacterized protein n=1 Tax=Panicum hallii var. hallii TaxID=1504633 RepID=A0A2T7E3N9_9POAL|nr:hypothetical protein GQ55_4G355400 [Panicum hallii var. hallii]